MATRAAEEATLKASLEASLPASVKNMTNVTVQQGRGGVYRIVVRVYDSLRRGEGQGT